MAIKLHDKLVLVNTSSSDLDEQIVEVLGFYGQGFAIVAFVNSVPEGYNPAFVISDACLQGIDEVFKNWIENYHPVPAEQIKSSSDIECYDHCIRKWRGVREKNLINGLRHTICSDAASFEFDHNNCSLCMKYSTESCEDDYGNQCPIVKLILLG